MVKPGEKNRPHSQSTRPAEKLLIGPELMTIIQALEFMLRLGYTYSQAPCIAVQFLHRIFESRFLQCR